MSEEKNLLEVSHLKQYFPVRKGFHTIPLKAVDDISFAIKPGETLGLVGESGCVKTTVGRTLLRLYQPTAGRIVFDGDVLFDSGEQYDEEGKIIVDANGNPVKKKSIDVDMLPYRKKMFTVFRQRIEFFTGLWNEILPARQHLTHRTDLRGNMFDTVDDLVIFITENNVTVFSHYLNDQRFFT